MSFSGLKLTDGGRRELAKAECGEQFCITHMVFGDGMNSGSTENSELKHKIMELPVSRIKRKDSEVILECDFNSTDVPQAFYWREFGIIANDTLCYYDSSPDDVEFINPQSDVIIKQKRLRVNLIISSDIEIKTTISSSLYVLFTDIVNNDTTTEEGYVADARIVEAHGREIDSIEESLNTLMDELYNSATESDIDRIIDGTYADTEESEFADMATETDIDNIIAGTFL
jgi:hypothetical protein